MTFFFFQELKEKQKEFESKAKLFSRLAEERSTAKNESLFKNNTAPLQRKQSTATKPNKQQAVVQPLQGQPEMNKFRRVFKLHECAVFLFTFKMLRLPSPSNGK